MKTRPASNRDQLLSERYADKILGGLSCFDRIIINGTLPAACHPKAMMAQMFVRDIRLFDYPSYANGLREKLRAHTEKLAAQNGLQIEFVRNSALSKEERVKAIVARRGAHPGLVHIFSAMETCRCFCPWHDKQSGRTLLKTDCGKCLHYYFYFIDQSLGLCYLRVPTWAPFRLQFYCNGHNWLACKLARAGIAFRQADNCFVAVEDFARAQQLADSMEPRLLHRKLDAFARRYCPVAAGFGRYHWSLMQLEYSTDLIFKSPEALSPIYQGIVRLAVHTIKAGDVAVFLGRKLSPLFMGELCSRFNTRLSGTRLRHQLGPAALKIYDKLGQVLRIETTVREVSFFKHHREVEHRDGSRQRQLAAVKKTIYSLGALRGLLGASNRRYLRFISGLEDTSQGAVAVEKIARPARDQKGRCFRGFNLFAGADLAAIIALLRGEHALSGLSNRLLQKALPESNGQKISRLLKRLRLHGLIRKIAHRYKYYLTALGRRLLLTALKLRENLIIPSLSAQPSPTQ